MMNRLANEKSPYLLQHAENPVEWYPWGDEALSRAREEGKPILVSIGYSACHWCHVMAHESFENQATASMMNDRFINIKVDREERPDVDAIYMEAVQALSGHGGWPLNVFLLPDGRPFYGGTYFPPVPQGGMPSWPQVLESVDGAYRERREDVLKNAEILTEWIARAQQAEPSTEPLSPDLLEAAYHAAGLQFDWRHGGFGDAPKFPQPLALDFVLRASHRLGAERGMQFLQLTLRRMAEGGIYDQLGGGFHRYSVDSAWVVPHFEKMLYDNALLATVYVHAFQATHDPFYRSIAEQTLDYLLGVMSAPDGGFYSAEDADSEGVEGKYYVWTLEEFRRILGEEAAAIAALRYGATAEGNFEGTTILTIARSIEQIPAEMVPRIDVVAVPEDLPIAEVESSLTRSRASLLAARARRVPPGKDTKILTSWNALAITALATAGRVLDRPDYLGAARQSADFILDAMRPSGQLVHSYRDGPSKVRGFLEDYAFLAESLITLYETVYEPRYLVRAQELANEMISRFWDDRQGAFFDTQAGDDLVVRPRSFFDNPIPSGNAAASFALLRLASINGNSAYTDRAVAAFQAVRDALAQAPLGFAYLLSALDFYLSPQRQIAIVGNPEDASTKRLVDVVYGRYLPDKVVAVGMPGSVPLLDGRQCLDGSATAYVCEHFACQMPVTEPADLQRQLEAG